MQDKLYNILEKSGIDYNYNSKIPDSIIDNITNDSRKVRKGSAFFAITGQIVDGHNYVNQALMNKASICFVEKDTEVKNEYRNKIIKIKNTKLGLAKFSRAFYNFPDKQLTLIGITGTNGKTTSTYMIRSILMKASCKVGVIGTLKCLIGNESYNSTLTTPQPHTLFALLYQMVKEGVNIAIMEISSHALALERFSELDLDTAVFTNLTEEHLNFHKDMENYFKSKLKIFDLLDNSNKKSKFAIINRDIPFYNRIIEYISNKKLSIITYGIEKDADYNAKIVTKTGNLLSNDFIVSFNTQKEIKEIFVSTTMLGKYNVYNSLCAIASFDTIKGLAKNKMEESIKNGLAEIKVNGRFEQIKIDNKGIVIIDFAHTSDALRNILKSIKELKPNKIFTVFGCGGDRDKQKRLLMGQVSAKYSDFVILTNDNPRTEDPQQIIKDIIPGIEKHNKDNYKIILDRKQAIYEAIALMNKSDVVLVAGKGHESYQILKNKTIHFSDREVVYEWINKNIKELKNRNN